jgi:hypothetical protein
MLFVVNTHSYCQHNKRFFKILNPIKLVVVMSVVELWKPQQRTLNARVTPHIDRWHFVGTVENNAYFAQ